MRITSKASVSVSVSKDQLRDFSYLTSEGDHEGGGAMEGHRIHELQGPHGIKVGCNQSLKSKLIQLLF